MIKELVLVSLIQCSLPAIVNFTNEEIMTKKDKKFLNIAQKRCGEIYSGSDCVKLFIKKRDNHGDISYSVVCGEPSNNQDARPQLTHK